MEHFGMIREEGSERQLREAVARMEAALHMLDELGAPGEIASHLDLAVVMTKVRLRQVDSPAADEFVAGFPTQDGDRRQPQPVNPWTIC